MASFFGAIWDFISSGDDEQFKSSAKQIREKNRFSSISAKATEGILQFPVIMSKSIDYDTAVLVSKACERSYAGFAKVVFSMNRDLSDTNTDNVSDYLRNFHQNDGLTTTDTDKSMFETFSFKDVKTQNTFECTLYFPEKPIMTSLLKEELRPYIEDFCLTNLNDVYKPRSLKDAVYTINMENNKVSKGYQRSYVKEAVGGVNDREKVFMDADVKKANELQPTFIKLEVCRNNGNNAVNYEITIGIKTTIHAVSSEEYITNLVDACEYKGTLFRFIKWSSGEIGFIRDFVLRMDLFAKETRNRVEGNSKWWEALKTRARSAKMSKVTSGNRLLPNATFVFTKAEADQIKANYGYDLMNVKVASNIMKEYFLLGYVVVDTATEVAYILFDGHKNFQITTFKALEREGANTERQLKEFGRIMKKM